MNVITATMQAVTEKKGKNDDLMVKNKTKKSKGNRGRGSFCPERVRESQPK